MEVKATKEADSIATEKEEDLEGFRVALEAKTLAKAKAAEKDEAVAETKAAEEAKAAAEHNKEILIFNS